MKKAFVRFRHTRFSKSFSYHLPYGAVETYRNMIQKATLDKLAALVKLCGFLMQTKVYLFWSSFEERAQVKKR